MQSRNERVKTVMGNVLEKYFKLHVEYHKKV